jgi:hypothetical protein
LNFGGLLINVVLVLYKSSSVVKFIYFMIMVLNCGLQLYYDCNLKVLEVSAMANIIVFCINIKVHSVTDTTTSIVY